MDDTKPYVYLVVNGELKRREAEVLSKTLPKSRSRAAFPKIP